MTGLVKLDMTAKAGAAVVRKFDIPGEALGEPFFVHRDPQALSKGSAAVDDGFLIVYSTNKAARTSTCKVRFRTWVNCHASVYHRNHHNCIWGPAGINPRPSSS
jgi:hypothetical protein